jgi:two-component system response regulator HydG
MNLSIIIQQYYLAQKPDTMRSSILVIDDDIRFFKQLELALAVYDLSHAKNSRQAGILLSNGDYDLVLLDLNLNEQSPTFEGLNYLKTIRQKHPIIPIIVLSKHSGYKEVSEAMGNGALSFFNKNDQVLLDWRNKIQQAITNKRLLESNFPFVGKSEKFDKLKAQLNNVDGKLKKPILLSGSLGVGKLSAARYFHNQSDSRYYEFVELDLSRVKPEDYRLEIAQALKTSKKGTLFMKSLHKYDDQAQQLMIEICLAGQGKSEQFKWIGQLISSSSTHLTSKMTEGAFNSDLYYHFQIISIPPLKERKEDIQELLKYELRKRGYRNLDKVLERKAKKYLISFDYPFNVKQLKNIVDSMLINMERLGKEEVDVECLPKEVVTKSYDGEDDFQLHEMEKALAFTELAFIEKALRKALGARGEAAKLLKIKNDDNLRNRIIKHNKKFPKLISQFPKVVELYPKIVK